MTLIREGSTSSISEAISGTFSVTGLITASAGIKLGSGSSNQVIQNSAGEDTLTLDADQNVVVAGHLTVTGNNIKSNTATVITLSADDATIAGDLTVTGASSGKITLGADSDDVDRSIVFGHGTLKTIIGIDDDQDVFAINADNTGAFEAVNDVEISSGGHMAIKGDLTVTGNDIKSDSATAITLSGANATIVGDLTVTGGDTTIKAANDVAASILMQADNSDDVGDDWKIVANTGQTLTFENDINSGTHAAMLTLTPHATPAQSITTVAGDLVVSGNNITFGNGESIHNEVDSVLRIISGTTLVEGTLKVEASSGHSQLRINAPSSGGDSKILFQEATVNNWYAGSYGADNTFHIGTGSAVATNTMLKLSTSGDLTITGGITSAGATIATRTSVNNLANDGEIPITATCVNIDANSSARTGIRFADTGTAGQMIIVNNTGGEDLTFHNTEGTAKVRGIHASYDVMEPNGVYIFVSDGTLWNYIGGGIDSQANLGMAATP
tara:strand:- start:43 stop:1542 length:1500 start_codon:yes stop_codon:yes gene_type:complete